VLHRHRGSLLRIVPDNANFSGALGIPSDVGLFGLLLVLSLIVDIFSSNSNTYT
jgi:hypothetical protein